MPSPLPYADLPPARPRAGLRRTAAPAALAMLIALLVTVTLSTSAVCMAAPAPATGTAAPTAAPPAGTTLRGVLERLVVEATAGPAERPDGSHAVAAAVGIPATWLRTPTARFAISSDAVQGIPAGSTVAVTTGTTGGGPAGGEDRTQELPVTSVTVLSRATATVRPAATAVHTVTVVLAQPPGATATNLTAAGLSRVVTGGVSQYWSRVSDGRISFTVAKSIGWTKLSSSCRDVWSVWEEARQRAGFVPGARRHLLVYVPSGAGCPAGLATVGTSADTGGYAMVGGATVGLVAHELGHNLGLGHSDALACAGSSDAPFTGSGFGGACRRVAYGDWYDVMGISWENLGSLSTAHAFRLGLLGTGAVATTRGPTRVTLRPVSGRAGLRSLRIQDPGGATYVVEYRPAAGADSWLDTGADWRGLTPGVLLRRTDPDDQTQTLLLDPSPTGTGTADTDTALRPGQVVATASGRVFVAVESVSPTAVTVAVAVDGAWPSLVVEPRGRLASGRQITIGQALATWGLLAS